MVLLLFSKHVFLRWILFARTKNLVLLEWYPLFSKLYKNRLVFSQNVMVYPRDISQITRGGGANRQTYNHDIWKEYKKSGLMVLLLFSKKNFFRWILFARKNILALLEWYPLFSKLYINCFLSYFSYTRGHKIRETHWTRKDLLEIHGLLGSI